jgi:hypothetical protein
VIVLAVEDLLQQRFGSVPSPFRVPLSIAMFIVLAWQIWALSPRDPESEAEKSPGVLLLAAICIGVLTWQREHAWAVVGTSVALALFFAWAGGKVYRRPLWLAIVGWSIAGPAVFLFPWPNDQRFMLVLVLGGLVTALQGSVNFVRALRVLRRPTALGRASGC